MVNFVKFEFLLSFLLSFIQFVGQVPTSCHDDPRSISWVQLTFPELPGQQVISDLRWEKRSFTTSDLPYEALLLRPPADKVSQPPLVVFPHGGPHVAIPADYLVWPVCLAALGFAVLLVNYRGSMGFGQRSIYSLPGKVGKQDVQDVQVHVAG